MEEKENFEIRPEEEKQPENSGSDLLSDEPELKEEETPKIFGRTVEISSRKKLFWTAILIALLNPVFAGFIVAAAFLSEPGLRREGKIIAAAAIVSAVIQVYFLMENSSQIV